MRHGAAIDLRDLAGRDATAWATKGDLAWMQPLGPLRWGSSPTDGAWRDCIDAMHHSGGSVVGGAAGVGAVALAVQNDSRKQAAR